MEPAELQGGGAQGSSWVTAYLLYNGSLSVAEEYLGLEGGPPMFRQDFTCPALLESLQSTVPYGAVTLHAGRSRPFR